MKAPFDNLPAVTELIRLYKEDKRSCYELAIYFDTTHRNCINTLRLHGVTIHRRNTRRRDWKFLLTRFSPTAKKATRVIKPTAKEVNIVFTGHSKYDHLLLEPVNPGHDYADILKKQGYKKPKVDSFQRIRSYKEKETPQ